MWRGQSVLDQVMGKLIVMIVPLMFVSGIVSMLPKAKPKRSARNRAGSSSSRHSRLADDLVLAPWWVSVGLAVVVLIVLPTMLPSLAPFAFIIAVVLFFLSGISVLRKWKTSRMLEGQTSIDTLRQIPWKRFEDLIAEAYRRQGYKVEETLDGGPDGGVDLRLGRDGKVTLVQCKQWPSGRPVSVEKVRELYGVMHGENASAAKFVVTTTFTNEAIAFARDKPLELIDGSQLLHLLKGVQTSGKIALPDPEPDEQIAPDCPKCGAAMVVREAKQGEFAGNSFWDCSTYGKTRCRGTRGIFGKS